MSYKEGESVQYNTFLELHRQSATERDQRLWQWQQQEPYWGSSSRSEKTKEGQEAQLTYPSADRTITISSEEMNDERIPLTRTSIKRGRLHQSGWTSECPPAHP